jgi:predicted membrane protein
VGYALIAPLGVPTQLFGFLQANPPSQQPYLGFFTGALALVASFALSSVPGAVLGFLALRALRRAGLR